MDNLTGVDKNYINWITEVSNRFKQSQIKAAVKVNDEMLHFTGSLEKIFMIRKESSLMEKDFIKQLAVICTDCCRK